MHKEDEHYQSLWENFAKKKSASYTEYKFIPTHRIGLTNFLRQELINKFLQPNAADVVLDVGCASGRQLKLISSKIRKGVGVDISQNFINKANENVVEHGNLGFRKAVVEKLPWSNAYFDKIICAEVLEHVTDSEVALKELLRVLKPGGILIVTVPNLNADGTLWGRVMRALRLRCFKPIKEFSEKAVVEHGDAHVREFTAKGIVTWLNKRGLVVEDIKTISWIDGPFMDFCIKIPLRINIIKYIIIYIEQLLTQSNMPLGRHLVVKLKKQYVKNSHNR